MQKVKGDPVTKRRKRQQSREGHMKKINKTILLSAFFVKRSFNPTGVDESVLSSSNNNILVRARLAQLPHFLHLFHLLHDLFFAFCF